MGRKINDSQRDIGRASHGNRIAVCQSHGHASKTIRTRKAWLCKDLEQNIINFGTMAANRTTKEKIVHMNLLSCYSTSCMLDRHCCKASYKINNNMNAAFKALMRAIKVKMASMPGKGNIKSNGMIDKDQQLLLLSNI
jgi:hypothetical protein